MKLQLLPAAEQFVQPSRKENAEAHADKPGKSHTHQQYNKPENAAYNIVACNIKADKLQKPRKYKVNKCRKRITTEQRKK